MELTLSKFIVNHIEVETEPMCVVKIVNNKRKILIRIIIFSYFNFVSPLFLTFRTHYFTIHTENGHVQERKQTREKVQDRPKKHYV